MPADGVRDRSGAQHLSSVRWPVALAALGMAGHGLGQNVMGPVTAEVMADFSVREAAMGVLIAAGAFGFMAGCLVGGFVVDRVGLKRALLLAWALVMASLGALVLSPSFVLVSGCYFAFGVASGFIQTSSNVLPTQIGGGAGMMNLVHSGFGVGALTAPLLVAGLLNIGAGWRSGFMAVSVMAAVIFGLWLFTRLPEAPSRQVAVVRTPLRRLARNFLVVMGGLSLLFYVGGEMGVGAWAVLSMQQRFNLDPLAAGMSLSLFWAAMLLARLAQGAVTTRFRIPAMVTISALISGLAIAAFGLAATPLQAYVAVTVAGLGAGGIYPDVMVYINGRFPRQIGAVTGILSTVAVSGTFILQPIVGRVAEIAGLTVGVMLVAGSMLMSALLLAVVWFRNRASVASSGVTG